MRGFFLMTHHSFVFLFSIIWCQVPAQNVDRGLFSDILNLSASPSPQAKINVEMFSDMGAWHAYCIPGANDNSGGFVGPIVMGMEGRFISDCSSSLIMKTEGKAISLLHFKSKHTYLPGLLTLSYENNSLKIVRQLIFINRRQAMIHTRIVNLKQRVTNIRSGIARKFL
jgi:putative isomerase